MAFNLSGFDTYAQRTIEKKLYSGLFSRMPLLTFLSGKGGTQSDIGRPGTYALIGGPGNITKAQMQVLDGSSEVHVRVQTGKAGGGKWLAERDTTSDVTTSQDQLVGTAKFMWALYRQPIKVWKNTLRLAGNNKFRIANALDEAVEMALEELYEELHKKLWTGNPTDQTAAIWDQPLGVIQAMDTANTYGNVNRAVETNWQSHKVTTAKTASLGLIDDANLTQGCANKGPGVDLVLTDSDNYLSLKRQALAEGGQIIHDTIPANGTVGYQNEAIRYGRTTITFDPQCPANNVAMFTMRDWMLEVHSKENFRVSKFKDNADDAAPGGDDAVTAGIYAMIRLRCNRPWGQCLYTNVTP